MQRMAFPQASRQGGAVQVDSFETRVESANGVCNQHLEP